MILYDDEDKDYDIINEEEVNCAGVRKSIKEIIPLKRVETH